MSKGNSYWSTARGKVGDIVVSTLRGQRIEKAYQPKVLNPRTNNQMLQRAKFADAVKFYKHAVAKFFQFAYEDKKQTESDYNAFMRHNTKNATYLKKSQIEGVFPAIGYNYMMAQGSLSQASIVNYLTGRATLSLPSLAVAGDAPTIGEISSALMADYSLQAGDIVTCVRILSSVTSLNSTPTSVPNWLITQFLVNTADTQLISAVNVNMGGLAGTGVYLDSVIRSSLAAYAVIFSRKRTGQALKVSNSYLCLNQVGIDIYNATTQSSWISGVLSSWGANGNAPLEGAYLGNSAGSSKVDTGNVESTVTSATPSTASETGSVTVNLVGTNLTNLTAGSFNVTGSVSITSFTTASATAASMIVNVQGSGTISYAGTTLFTATVSGNSSSSDTGSGTFQG